jgi:hypothetical protein
LPINSDCRAGQSYLLADWSLMRSCIRIWQISTVAVPSCKATALTVNAVVCSAQPVEHQTTYDSCGNKKYPLLYTDMIEII